MTFPLFFRRAGRFVPLIPGLIVFLLVRPIQADDDTMRTPVILDTDIGDDSDDYWALAFALKSPDLDVKLITTTYGKQPYRAALIAKFLTAAGRTDIPIGLGAGRDGHGNNQAWLGDFTRAAYTGKVLADGPQAIIDTINASPTPVTVIAIGPLNTLGAALQKDPGLASKANLCAMAGSVRVGYGNKPGQIGEYNICMDVPDAQRVFAAPWKSISITPLDTGASATLAGTRYLTLLGRDDPLLNALLQCSALAHRVTDPATINFSGSGFDPVAVLLAEKNPERFANLEHLNIVVDDHGKTTIDPAGTPMNVATTWKDLDGYLDHLKQTLLLPTSPAP